MTLRTKANGYVVLLVATALALVLARVQVGTAADFDLSLGSALRGVGACFGIGEPLPGAAQLVARGRLIDATVALLVGGSLALSGALLQGLFRNDLASPGLIGVTSGAAVGVVAAIMVLGGASMTAFGDGGQVMQAAAERAPLLITACAFVGALVVAGFVTLLATRGGRISVPTLLLVGVAINACLGGILAAAQDLLLKEKWELAQALFTWLFGNLSERSIDQVWVAAAGLTAAALAIPFVARELDLLSLIHI